MDEIQIGKTYRHFKGILVNVITIAKHSETLEDMVIYEHQGTHETWARPLTMFLSKEDVSARADNVTGQKYRFELIK